MAPAVREGARSGGAAVPDQVFLELAEAIVSGRVEAGEKLPTQRRLASELGASMASVREAVKRLEQLRLVEVRQGDAMRVLDWRAHGGLDVMAHLLFRGDGFEPAMLGALMEARRSMLSEVARLAAVRRSDEQAKQLAELAERIAAVADGGSGADEPSAQALDFEFFAVLVDAAQNLVFALVMNSIRAVYFARAELFAPIVARPHELAPLYRAVVEAIRARHANEAGDAVAALTSAHEQRLVEVGGVKPPASG